MPRSSAVPQTPILLIPVRIVCTGLLGCCGCLGCCGRLSCCGSLGSCGRLGSCGSWTRRTGLVPKLTDGGHILDMRPPALLRFRLWVDRLDPVKPAISRYYMSIAYSRKLKSYSRDESRTKTYLQSSPSTPSKPWTLLLLPATTPSMV